MTTIGYGEITPRSFLGRLITVPLLLCGLLLIALPSFVLGREFSIVWDDLTHGGV
jgi:potassium voltage-gated channel Shal-related subfamily D protein 2